jgi:5-methylcytosine-specific restriction protein A
MPERPLAPCKHCGCPELTRNKSGYCDDHQDEYKPRDYQSENKRRGSASSKGYGYRWQKYRVWFLRQPANQICKLHLPGCTVVATEVDHIEPPNGPGDPNFWNMENHQPACRHCNSIKGRKMIKGTYDMMEEMENGMDKR